MRLGGNQTGDWEAVRDRAGCHPVAQLDYMLADVSGSIFYITVSIINFHSNAHSVFITRGINIRELTLITHRERLSVRNPSLSYQTANKWEIAVVKLLSFDNRTLP